MADVTFALFGLFKPSASNLSFAAALPRNLNEQNTSKPSIGRHLVTKVLLPGLYWVNMTLKVLFQCRLGRAEPLELLSGE